jgi:uncharacterized membrane protein (UPF0182 family)
MIDTNSTVQIPEAEPALVLPVHENHTNGDRPPPIEFRNIEPPAWVGKLLKWLFPVAAVLFIAMIAVPSFLQKWLWMRQLDYSVIFWTIFSIRLGLACGAFTFAFLFVWINLRLAARNSLALSGRGPVRQRTTVLALHVVTRGTALATAVVAAIFAGGIYSQWDTYLRFRYGTPFGLADPVYGRDIGFYIFQLPWYELLQGSLAFLTVLTLVGVVAQYSYFGLMRFTGRTTDSNGMVAAKHSSVLLMVLAATLGWGYYLDRFDLLDSVRGVVFGVGYTADHATLPALWGMLAVSVVACLLLALNFYKPRLKATVVGVGCYVALYVIGVMIVPSLVQKFVVQPNELALETPYLKNYIEFSRKAYRLDAIQETAYPAMADLTPQVLARNNETIQNIRLWDKRPLLQTYQQTQAIRLYYKFDTVDVDRYHLVSCPINRFI